MRNPKNLVQTQAHPVWYGILVLQEELEQLTMELKMQGPSLQPLPSESIVAYLSTA